MGMPLADVTGDARRDHDDNAVYNDQGNSTAGQIQF